MRLLLASLFVLTACSETSVKDKTPLSKKALPYSNGQGPANPARQHEDADSQSVVTPSQLEAEKVTPPQPITGSLLRCAMVFTAKEQVPTAVVGCRYEFSNGARVDTNVYNITYEFTATSALGVPVKQKNGGSNFDIQFEFAGSGFEQSNQAAREAKIESRAISKIDGQVLVQLERQAANDLPLGRNDGNSGWTGWTDHFRDDFTYVIWSKDDQSSYTQSEAIAKCSAMTVGDRKWRLPRLLDMAMGFDSGLGNLFKEAENMAIETQPIEGYWTNEADGLLGTVMFLKGPGFGTSGNAPSDTRHAVLCISE